MSYATKRGLLSKKSKSKSMEYSGPTYSDLPALRRKRTLAFNRLRKTLEVAYLAEANSSHVDEFMAYYSALQKHANNFEEAHTNILCIVNDSDADGEDEIRSEFDDYYFKVLAIHRKLIASSSSTTESSAPQIITTSAIRLPKIDLPKFNGNIKEWPMFYDAFNSLIHTNGSLSDSDRMQYLRASVYGDALTLIRTFPLQGVYYEEAYKTLIARYRDKRELAFTCWREILNINLKVNSPTEYRRVLDLFNENLVILKGLNLPTEHWDFVICYHLLSKLDSKTRCAFEQAHPSSELPQYSTLKTFLESQCDALVRDTHFAGNRDSQLTANNGNKYNKSMIKYPSNKIRSITTSLLSDSEKSTVKPVVKHVSSTPVPVKGVVSKCSFCSDTHSLSHCKQFATKSIQERLDFAKTNRWCFNCLKPSHILRDCKSPFSCLTCRKRHHTLIHQDNESNLSEQNYTPNDSIRVLTSTGDASVVLLSTAVINIRDSSGNYQTFRAVIDSGSQANFISERAVNRLGLIKQTTSRHVRGVGQSSASISGAVQLQIGINGQVAFNIEALTIPYICGNMPSARLDKSSWLHIRDLNLADPDCDKPGPIDILIGAEVFPLLLLPGNISGGPKQPSALNSVFGWLLLGSVSNNHQQCNANSFIISNDQSFQEIKEPILEYCLNTITYGVSSSSFHACQTVRQLIKDEGSDLPLAKFVIASDVYINDIVTVHSNTSTVLETKRELIELLKRGHKGFRKWATKDLRLLSNLPSEYCLTDNISMDIQNSSTSLGLKWKPDSDGLKVEVKSLDRAYSKRNTSSELAQIGDPLGFLSPMTFFKSSDNSADIETRIQMPSELINNSLWWAGPSWLSEESQYWPRSNSDPSEEELCAEEKVQVLLSSDISPHPIDFLMTRYSSIRKIQRIIGLWLRYIHNLKYKNNRLFRLPLNRPELHNALLVIVKRTQALHFSDEIKRLKDDKPLSKQMRKLNPFIDSLGILRVGGRLSRSGLEFSHKHPALLPRQDNLTYMIIDGFHRENCHPGINTLHYLLSQQFWILSAKRTIRHRVSRCLKCFKTNPTPLEPFMSDLPAVRVNQVKPFSIVGCDYGGPFRIKSGNYRGAKISKAYLCLFVCFTTKAVHLEVATDLTSVSFIAALRRFVGRRGRVSIIHSDRGTNFVGAYRELSTLMQNASHAEQIEFRMNPPSSPHFGGIWEIQIKAVKTAMYSVINNQSLALEELFTFFIQIEAMLNSRPLYPLSSDPNDFAVLTPGHFLTLEPLTSIPDENLYSINLTRLGRWQLVQRIQQDIWRRWKNEYLHSLTQRAKWTKQSKPLEIGSVVIIKSESPPLHWPIARVDQLHKSVDGVIRIASVRLPNGSSLTRPLTKICPLPTQTD